MKRLDVVLASALGLEVAIAALAATPGAPELGGFTNPVGLLVVLGLLLLIRRGHRWPWAVIVVLTLLSMTQFLADGYTLKGFALLGLSAAEIAVLSSSPMREHLRKPRADKAPDGSAPASP
jgi:hypothetical protein